MQPPAGKETSQRILLLGRVQRPRGVKGELRVTCRGDLLTHMEPGEMLSLYTGEAIKDGFIEQPAFVESARLEELYPVANEVISVRLSALNDRDSAEKYCGLYFGLSLEEAKIRFGDEEEPYLFQYIAMDVYDGADGEENNLIGKVERIEDSGLQWLIVKTIVKTNDNEIKSEIINEIKNEIMVPLNGPFVEEVDFKENRLMCRGLKALGETDLEKS